MSTLSIAERATPNPCQACPWRLENQGKRHPDGWYTKANRKRLWGGLRRGEGMSCHPTDPTNPVSDKATAAGYRPAPEHSSMRECIGALILQQRELQILNDAADLRVYRKARPGGLTREGVLRLLERLTFGGSLGSAPAMPRPDLNAEVGHDPLPWERRTRAAGETP